MMHKTLVIGVMLHIKPITSLVFEKKDIYSV